MPETTPTVPTAGPGVPAYVGIDIGSTTTKAIAFAADGSPLASGSAGYEISRPAPDHAEQEGQDWIDAVDACVARLAAQVDLAPVRAIGVTSQVDTHVPVDAELRPLRPALLWQDVRTAATAESLNERLGPEGRLAGWGDERPIDASNPVPRALWLAEHEPDVWAATRWLLLPKDLVVGWLTGAPSADPLGSFKVVGPDGRYVAGVAHAPGLAERLAPLASPEAPAGGTVRAWHGIAAGTVVATGTMDAFGNVLGSGLHEVGHTMATIGTSVIVAALGADGTPAPGVVAFAPFRSRHVHAGPTQSGGESLRWWARLSGHTVEDVVAAAATAVPGCGGVVFAPHLMGERAPLWDDHVRAWFTGLSSSTTFADLSRAVLEGVAYSLRELLEAVEVATPRAGSLTMSGGGSRSELWCQIVADVTGRVVRRSREADTAVVGAATLAASAVTGDDPWRAAASLSQVDRVFEPDPGVTATYDALFTLYRQTYAALGPVHDRLAAHRTTAPGGTP
ncbi:xylulokinase [Nocardioides zeae]